MKRVVVVLSGGLDSTTLLHHHIRAGDIVRALCVNYGQRHQREIQSAHHTCARLQVPFLVADLHDLSTILPGSSQTDSTVDVPEGHYAEESMKATVVPNRNMILLSVALGHAIAHKFEAVSYAAHAGDHAIYPDCRPEFVDALNEAAKLCDWHPVEILRPFIKQTKAEIVRHGANLGVNFSYTYSCYKGKEKHCGKCGTCVERKEAFALAKVFDPTEYSPF